MHPFRVLAAGEQLASHLKQEIATGALTGHMPGVHQLAASYGVHRRTAEEALRHLEREQIIISQGVGRRRRIAGSHGTLHQRAVRLTVILGFSEDAQANYIIDLQHRLAEAGHTISIAERSLSDLRMDIPRVARMVSKAEADACVVVAGPREGLEWFAAQPFPAFALFGRRSGLPLAGIGPNKAQAIRRATKDESRGSVMRIATSMFSSMRATIRWVRSRSMVTSGKRARKSLVMTSR